MRGKASARRVGIVVKILMLMLATLTSTAPGLAATGKASTPPMGWNSWDAYGLTVTEDQFKANAVILAGLKKHGWNTAVIDEGWYMANPLGAKRPDRDYHYDRYGRLVPVTTRFPSALDGHGLKALADWTHKQGLKFGVHIVRGIPRAAADANMPIENSPFHAQDAAVKSDICPWDDSNYGVADNAAGQAYYDSLARQYEYWGVDFLKIDCISDHPYKGAEIRQVANAIRKVARPIVLSLSPGPTNIDYASEVARSAQMWRIMDDLWDSWTFSHPDPNSTFPNGVRNAFDALALWNRHVRPGQWPDADMLPFGSLKPHPGWGDPRQSRLSEAETRTAFTLWSIARAPLILGGNLTEAPGYLMPLLRNDRVLALNREDRTSRPIETLPSEMIDVKVWVSGPRAGNVDTVAIFNVGGKKLNVNAPLSAFGVAGVGVVACDLWTNTPLAGSDRAIVTIASHDVALIRIAKESIAGCSR